jgi:hypothetical protein
MTTIVPGAGNPQALNRYAYVLNDPIRYNDPTGHRNCEEDGYNCPGDDYASSLKTYASAGIKVQNPNWPPRSIVGGLARLLGPYTGIGPAKVTDKQMETPYGDPIIDPSGHNRGYGLGMRTARCTIFGCPAGQADQSDPNVAVEAMGKRIALVTNVCLRNDCSSTDIFVVAALAENGPGFTQKDMSQVIAGKKYETPANYSVTINWKSYLRDVPGRDPSNRALITDFAKNVTELQKQGSYIPPNIDWDYVNELTGMP